MMKNKKYTQIAGTIATDEDGYVTELSDQEVEDILRTNATETAGEVIDLKSDEDVREILRPESDIVVPGNEGMKEIFDNIIRDAGPIYTGPLHNAAMDWLSPLMDAFIQIRSVQVSINNESMDHTSDPHDELNNLILYCNSIQNVLTILKKWQEETEGVEIWEYESMLDIYKDWFKIDKILDEISPYLKVIAEGKPGEDIFTIFTGKKISNIRVDSTQRGGGSGGWIFAAVTEEDNPAEVTQLMRDGGERSGGGKKKKKKKKSKDDSEEDDSEEEDDEEDALALPPAKPSVSTANIADSIVSAISKVSPESQQALIPALQDAIKGRTELELAAQMNQHQITVFNMQTAAAMQRQKVIIHIGDVARERIESTTAEDVARFKTRKKDAQERIDIANIRIQELTKKLQEIVDELSDSQGEKFDMWLKNSKKSFDTQYSLSVSDKATIAGSAAAGAGAASCLTGLMGTLGSWIDYVVNIGASATDYVVLNPIAMFLNDDQKRDYIPCHGDPNGMFSKTLSPERYEATITGSVADNTSVVTAYPGSTDVYTSPCGTIGGRWTGTNTCKGVKESISMPSKVQAQQLCSTVNNIVSKGRTCFDTCVQRHETGVAALDGCKTMCRAGYDKGLNDTKIAYAATTNNLEAILSQAPLEDGFTCFAGITPAGDQYCAPSDFFKASMGTSQSVKTACIVVGGMCCIFASSTMFSFFKKKLVTKPADCSRVCTLLSSGVGVAPAMIQIPGLMCGLCSSDPEFVTKRQNIEQDRIKVEADVGMALGEDGEDYSVDRPIPITGIKRLWATSNPNATQKVRVDQITRDHYVKAMMDRLALDGSSRTIGDGGYNTRPDIQYSNLLMDLEKAKDDLKQAKEEHKKAMKSIDSVRQTAFVLKTEVMRRVMGTVRPQIADAPPAASAASADSAASAASADSADSAAATLTKWSDAMGIEDLTDDQGGGGHKDELLSNLQIALFRENIALRLRQFYSDIYEYKKQSFSNYILVKEIENRMLENASSILEVF